MPRMPRRMFVLLVTLAGAYSHPFVPTVAVNGATYFLLAYRFRQVDMELGLNKALLASVLEFWEQIRVQTFRQNSSPSR